MEQRIHKITGHLSVSIWGEKKNCKIYHGVKELKKQLMAIRPRKETPNNNALQVFQSQFMSLKAQITMVTSEGDKSRDPFKDAHEDREHLLTVIHRNIRALYLNKHNVHPDESSDTTLFWRQILQFQRTYAETMDRKVTYSTLEARPREESQSYVSMEDVVCCVRKRGISRLTVRNPSGQRARIETETVRCLETSNQGRRQICI